MYLNTYEQLQLRVLKCIVQRILREVKTSTSDLDPGSGAFFTPESRVQDPGLVVSRSQIPDPTHISES
jgi:hypothetical protein